MLERSKPHAFTLMEAIVSLAMIFLLTGVGFTGLTMANQMAATARLYTLAQEAARNEIDQIASGSPFDPQYPAPYGPKIPTLVISGTTKTFPLSAGTTTATVPLYVDPTNNNTVVNATMTIVLANLSSYTASGVTINPNGVSATVTVAYTYRNHSYTVQLNTIRVADDN